MALQPENAPSTPDGAQPTVAGVPVDARVRVSGDEGSMTISVVIDPPQDGGADITKEALRAALEKEGIVFGVDEAALDRACAPLYDERVVVARGVPAQDGQDGTVKELFPRQVEKQHREREDGTVDYKELTNIIEVREGATICEITPPTTGTDGTNTKGKPIKAREGKKALPPMGENTRVSADGLRTEAAVNGHLVFRDGRFVVDTVYRVQDVDYEVGNITFFGDVQVNGDMMDGFAIKSQGTVTLRGQVGAVEISAENIVLEKGINGKGKAVIEATKTVKAGFVENCTIRAGELVTAQSIINSQVECEGDVEVQSGKGIICGGKITAFGSVKAKEIGNEANTLTIITLGVTPRMLKERKRMSDQLDDVQAHIDEMNKNVAYIERLVADGRPVPPERVQMLQRAKLQMPLSERKKEQLEKGLAELEARMMDNLNASQLVGRTVHPPTKISIGSLSSNVIETRQNVRVYKNSEGNLSFGTA